MNLPPEVYGALVVAQKHLTTANTTYYRFSLHHKRKRKHLAKVQKLVAKAAKYLNGRELK